MWILNELAEAIFDGMKTFLCYVINFFLDSAKPFLLWLIQDVMPWDIISFVDLAWLVGFLDDMSLLLPVENVFLMLGIYGLAWTSIFLLQKVFKAVPTFWG